MLNRKNYHGLQKCIISEDVILFTEKVLKECGKLKPPNEGFLYWAGTKENGIGIVDMVIAPMFNSNPLRVTTTHYANALMVKTLGINNKMQIAQVHSHPGRWVDHSEGDDELAPFKVNGLYSIVVPYYCLRGMVPLSNCGIHLFWNEFKRMPRSLIDEVFKINRSLRATIIDMRHGNYIDI